MRTPERKTNRRSALRAPGIWIAVASIAVGAAALTLYDDEPAPGARQSGTAEPRRSPPSGRGAGRDRTAPDRSRATAASEAPRPRGEVLVRAAYGGGPGDLGVSRPVEGAPEGPMSFAVDPRGRIVVLDQTNARVQIFEKGAEPRSLQLPGDTFQDVAVDPAGRVVAMDRLATGTIAFFDESGAVDHMVSLAGPNIPEGGAITAMFAREDGVWVEVEHASVVRVADERGEPDPEQPIVAGRFSADGASVLRASLDGPGGIVVTSEPLSGSTARGFVARPAFDMPVYAIRALESDAAGRTYVAVVTMIEDDSPPFDVLAERQTVVVLDADGREIRRVDVAPETGPEETLNAIRVGADGAIYQLVLGDEAATVERF